MTGLLSFFVLFLYYLVHLALDDGGDGGAVALLDVVLHRRSDPGHAQQLQPKIIANSSSELRTHVIK